MKTRVNEKQQQHHSMAALMLMCYYFNEENEMTEYGKFTLKIYETLEN